MLTTALYSSLLCVSLLFMASLALAVYYRYCCDNLEETIRLLAGRFRYSEAMVTVPVFRDGFSDTVVEKIQRPTPLQVAWVVQSLFHGGAQGFSPGNLVARMGYDLTDDDEAAALTSFMSVYGTLFPTSDNEPSGREDG